MGALDVAPQDAPQFPYGRAPLDLTGTDNGPTLFSELPEELARSLAIQDLALVGVGLGRPAALTSACPGCT